MTRVLITGATGFVGTALCPLLEEAGFDVIRAVRKPVGSENEFVIGDLSTKTDWSVALKNVDCVVHLAARVHVMDDTALDPLAVFRAINRDATKALAEKAAEAGVKTFIYLSSVKAAGEMSGEAPLRESDSPRPQNDPYGQSKLEAEQALQEIADRTGMSVRSIRPPLVYGPGVKGNFLSLLKICSKRIPLPLGAIKNKRSLVFLGNLTDAILACIKADPSGFKTYYVSDGTPVSTPELIRAVGKALGATPLLLPIPEALLSLAGALTGKKTAVSRLTGSLEIESSLIEQDLGWKPPYSFDQGLAETARWFKGRNR